MKVKVIEILRSGNHNDGYAYDYSEPITVISNVVELDHVDAGDEYIVIKTRDGKARLKLPMYYRIIVEEDNNE